MDIKVGKTCDGKGTVQEDIGTHHSEYVTHKCSSCHGTGRIVTREYSYRVPYIPNDDNQLLYKIDSLIINAIRALEREYVGKPYFDNKQRNEE